MIVPPSWVVALTRIPQWPQLVLVRLA
jgi:hypothetical protein